MDSLPVAFNALSVLQQFIVYKLIPSTKRQGKLDKLPLDYKTGFLIDANDSSAWTDHKTALSAAKIFGTDCGIGFVFTEDDPYFFLDIDNCLQPDNQWSSIATQLCAIFNWCSDRGI